MKTLLIRRIALCTIRIGFTAAILSLLCQCSNIGTYGIARVAPPPSPAAEGSARAELLSRPGLGTGAGDVRHQSVAKAQFTRKAGGPDATSSFHYNDEDGARVMAEQWGGSTWTKGGAFPLAGGKLKARITAGYRDVCRHYRAGDRTIVIGRSGRNWELHLDNESGHRVEVVVSVDGLDVMDGKAARTGKPGYVIEKDSSLTISGWRVNQDEVRSFLFASVADSKAASAGRARNVGVVGVAVYEEDEVAVRQAREREAARRDAARAFDD